MNTQQRYSKLAEFGKELLSKTSLEEGLELITQYAKEVIEAQRCSVFIYDEQMHTLWTGVSDGIDRLVINADHGVVGHTFIKKEPILANDAYAHPAFLAGIDKQTGYKTKNLMTAPIFDSTHTAIGVVELLNKEGGFSEEDKKFLTFFAHFISGFLEMLKVYEEA